MDKVEIQKRIDEIEKALAQAVQQHAVLSGQLLEAKHWLAEHDKAAAAKDVEAELVE